MEAVRRLLVSALLSLASSAMFGQTVGVKLPCVYRGDLLRASDGKVVRFSSAEMKDRATRRVELGGILRQADISGTAIVDVLVGADGEVVCLKCQARHAFIRVEVEKAVKSWAFKPAESKGKPVAYLGRLQFRLCNILCGEQGPSMTLLK